MVAFNKVRLAGFKSFVDATELLIEPGVTGVVGPNGCGKSNLVEALRWAMGETSAKQMRGGEMDDVIFGGTANRPARNIAEVTISLDNRKRTAPAIFNSFDDLEVTRRIERGQGSLYKVNGKEVRARDVQLLFADSATGARSPALVSQGRIGAIINAKPADRRALLEEAAGIAGLHSRRHDAEIRLKGAESNLARLDDVLTALDTQSQALKKQARQAQRYRTISDTIRKAEAALLAARWEEAIAQVDLARIRFERAEADVISRTEVAAVAATHQADAAAGLPQLRQNEAEAAARLQRLILAREQLDAEEARVAAARVEVETRLQQIAADREQEIARIRDAEEALAKLEAERQEIESARQGEEEAQAAARERLSEVSSGINALEAELTQLTEKVASDEAKRNALTRRIEELDQRARMLSDRLRDVEANRAAAEAEAASDAEAKAAEAQAEAARQRLEDLRAAVMTAEAALREARQARDESQRAFQEKDAARARAKAEESALAEMLAGDVGEWPPLVDSLSVDSGFEAALGAALGDDLSAPADDAASMHWHTLAPLDAPPALPLGVFTLASHVRGHAALARRLSQIGLVADAAEGRAKRDQLLPGQRLVTKDGDLFRWDGFTVAAGAPSPAAVRLKQKNRLVELAAQSAAAVAEADAARGVFDIRRTATEEAEAAERRARDDARAAEQYLAQARDVHAKLAQKAAAALSRLNALTTAAQQIGTDIAEAERQLSEGRNELASIGDSTDARERMASLRADLAERRSQLIEARAAHDRLAREIGDRKRRLDLIAQESQSWRSRLDASRRQGEELDARSQSAEGEQARLASRPAEIAESRRALLSDTAEAETARRELADALAVAESRLVETDKALKTAEADLATAREERVRAESAVEQGKQNLQNVAIRVRERLECAPDQLREVAEMGEEDQFPPIEDMERKVERLVRERDNMGPVNLRAEQEAEELEQQINGMKAEREDLIAAIARLRQGINELNREGRERLLASYEAVDKHFRQLFVRLFGGGRAHLTLTESDDPLEAGLEIMASPPGKRLQILSLLSGGEQALTALALLFAVFLTNPAPICVLDEVDAPLDDANVDRFCTLVSEMAHTAATRFLVITHHRMTMARMDRLFGVTMGERGISQLVSVDLKAAEELRESA